jgi:hypothetical protein
MPRGDMGTPYALFLAVLGPPEGNVLDPDLCVGKYCLYQLTNRFHLSWSANYALQQ